MQHYSYATKHSSGVDGLQMKLTSKDFERLTDCQMEFAAVDWKKQADRFTDDLDWSHKFIYWTENYLAALFACEYLTSIGFDSNISWDEGGMQYCFTTNYAGSWVNA